MNERTFRMLVSAEDAALVSDEYIEEALDWFDDAPRMSTSDFLDRLFSRDGGPTDAAGAELDLDSLDNPAARAIVARARRMRAERLV